jgi:hypothetical protein
MRFNPIDVEKKCEEIAADLELSLRAYMTDIPEALVEILVSEIWQFNHTEQAISQLESEHIQALEDQAQERKFEKEGM